MQDACLVLLISKRQPVCPSLSHDVPNLVYQTEHLDALGRAQCESGAAACCRDSWGARMKWRNTETSSGAVPGCGSPAWIWRRKAP